MTLPGDFETRQRQFTRELRIREKAPKTITVYGGAVAMLGEWLATLPDEPVIDDGIVVIPAAVAHTHEVTRNHIKEFLLYLQTRPSQRDGKPLSKGYRNNIFRGLQAFWKWMVLDEHMDHDPMAHVAPPKADQKPVPVLTVDQLRAIVATCGKGRRRPFHDVRDEALLRVLIDSGVRVSEAVVDLDDLKMNHNTMRVTGKGAKTRDVYFGDRTAKALDGYLLARTDHRSADKSPLLWLGRWGPMTSSGIYQVVVDRGHLLGLDLHPHQFRHTLAHQHRLNGGTTTSLMRLMGWESESMAHRYGASAADERARAEHAHLSLGDRI